MHHPPMHPPLRLLLLSPPTPLIIPITSRATLPTPPTLLNTTHPNRLRRMVVDNLLLSLLASRLSRKGLLPQPQRRGLRPRR